MRAWVHLLRAHAAITRQFNSELVHAHGLTLNDYEVLLHLSRAPEGRLRRVDLAERILLTASGITRLLDGLERLGYVERGQCPGDGRVTYAVLTEAGYEKLCEASPTHLESIRGLFGDRFADDELETLARLLERLPEAGEAASCGVDR